jgi:hypothetical protein
MPIISNAPDGVQKPIQTPGFEHFERRNNPVTYLRKHEFEICALESFNKLAKSFEHFHLTIGTFDIADLVSDKLGDYEVTDQDFPFFAHLIELSAYRHASDLKAVPKLDESTDECLVVMPSVKSLSYPLWLMLSLKLRETNTLLPFLDYQYFNLLDENGQLVSTKKNKSILMLEFLIDFRSTFATHFRLYYPKASGKKIKVILKWIDEKLSKFADAEKALVISNQSQVSKSSSPGTNFWSGRVGHSSTNDPKGLGSLAVPDVASIEMQPSVQRFLKNYFDLLMNFSPQTKLQKPFVHPSMVKSILFDWFAIGSPYEDENSKEYSITLDQLRFFIGQLIDISRKKEFDLCKKDYELYQLAADSFIKAFEKGPKLRSIYGNKNKKIYTDVDKAALEFKDNQ